MAALRKPELEPYDKKLPLLLVINHEIQSTRRRGWVTVVVKTALLCAVLLALLNMAHGIAHGL
jgi:hypothetical protein